MNDEWRCSHLGHFSFDTEMFECVSHSCLETGVSINVVVETNSMENATPIWSYLTISSRLQATKCGKWRAKKIGRAETCPCRYIGKRFQPAQGIDDAQQWRAPIWSQTKMPCCLRHISPALRKGYKTTFPRGKRGRPPLDPIGGTSKAIHPYSSDVIQPPTPIMPRDGPPRLLLRGRTPAIPASRTPQVIPLRLSPLGITTVFKAFPAATPTGPFSTLTSPPHSLARSAWTWKILSSPCPPPAALAPSLVLPHAAGMPVVTPVAILRWLLPVAGAVASAPALASAMLAQDRGRSMLEEIVASDRCKIAPRLPVESVVG